jgi:hypothetical protein
MFRRNLKSGTRHMHCAEIRPVVCLVFTRACSNEGAEVVEKRT